MDESKYNAFTNQDKKEKAVDNKGKYLVLCLDKSGSMSGRPMESLKVGAELIAENLFSQPEMPFERFITMLYDTQINRQEPKDLESYKRMIQSVRAGSATDFRGVFEEIQWLIDDDFKKGKLKEITVIFFTDGQDTVNNKQNVNFAFDLLKKSCDKEIKSKFLSIGFSRDHDAAFMNKIAQAGTDLGNFFYIDTQNANYGDLVKEKLTESLDIAMEGAGGVKLHLQNQDQNIEISHNLTVDLQFGESEVQDEGETPPIIGVNLNCQAIMRKDQIEGLQAKLVHKDDHV